MTVELRVFRTSRWEIDPHQEILYGGPPPVQRLVHTDTLQMRVGDDWQDVPVVEAEKPPHPFPPALRRRF